MTPTEVVAAYRAVLELSKAVLPYKTARQVAALNRALRAEHDTVVAAERALAEEHGGVVSPMGSVDFPDADSVEAFNREHAAYMEQDADIRLPKVDVSKYTNLLRLSPETICALDGIVTFERDAQAEEAETNG